MSASLQVGQAVSVQRVFSQDDFDRFAVLSGDDNPIHVDPQFAARSKFGRTVAHGMFLYSVVCGVLSTRLPGPGTVQVEQELMFPSATYTGEEVTIRLEVREVRQADGLADLITLLTKADGDIGLQGRTLVRISGQSGPLAPDPATMAQAVSSESPSFKGLEVGQRAELRRIFTQEDLAEYAALTGDANPVYTDGAYARRVNLPGPLIPGGLLAGLFSTLLGTRLPGPGTNYLKQRLEFLAPAHLGEKLTSAVEIVRIRPEKQLVNLGTLCANREGETVCRGEALVLVSDVEDQSQA